MDQKWSTILSVPCRHNSRNMHFDITPARGKGQEAQTFKKVSQQLVLWRAYQASGWRGAESAPE